MPTYQMPWCRKPEHFKCNPLQCGYFSISIFVFILHDCQDQCSVHNHHEHELNNLVTNYIINYTTAQKLSWLGHVHRMTNDRMVKKLCKWKPEFAVLGGRPETGWENDIKEYLRIMKISNWTKCMQDRVKWKEVVEKAETFEECSCSA